MPVQRSELGAADTLPKSIERPRARFLRLSPVLLNVTINFMILDLESDMRTRSTSGAISGLTVALLCVTIVFGLVHHTDHVLRVDHSGWPFRSDVTAFTFSLMAYPVLLFALFGPGSFFWLRWALLLGGLAFTLFAHAVIETPGMQYTMWAENRSSDSHDVGSHNLPGYQSVALGVTAVGVAMALNVLLVASCLSMLRDGLRSSARGVADARGGVS